MFGRRHLYLTLVVATLLLSGCDGNSTRNSILADGAGPMDADAPDEFTTTESGLQYRVLRKGDGETPTLRDSAVVHFAGWLNSGHIFETSYNSKQPITLPMTSEDGRLIGRTQGLLYVAEGGMIELIVPGDLGYGQRGLTPTIPPNAPLHYLFELVEVIPAPEPVEPGLPDSDAVEEFTTTDSGLKYRILRKGTGDKPAATDSVEVHYKGWLDDGTEFESSYERGVPDSFLLENVIDGWTEGLQYVSEGGMIELEIPTDLGYGSEGKGSKIPANATLHFSIELLDIQDQP